MDTGEGQTLPLARFSGEIGEGSISVDLAAGFTISTSNVFREVCADARRRLPTKSMIRPMVKTKKT